MSIKIICDLCGNEIQSGYEVHFKVLPQQSIYGKGDFPLGLINIMPVLPLGGVYYSYLYSMCNLSLNER
jgi:hypothetical protein